MVSAMPTSAYNLMEYINTNLYPSELVFHTITPLIIGMTTEFFNQAVRNVKKWTCTPLHCTKDYSLVCAVKPGSHLRHNNITGRSRKREEYLVLIFYVSSVNNT